MRILHVLLMRKKQSLNLTINPKLLEWARQNEINLSGLLESHLWHIRAGIQKGGIGTVGSDMRPAGFEPALPAWEAGVLARLNDGRNINFGEAFLKSFAERRTQLVSLL